MSTGGEKVRNHAPTILLGASIVAWITWNASMSPSAGPPVVCDRDVIPDAGTVVMLSASWCRYCRSARAYLQDEGIVHCEYDVETTPEGRRQFAEMTVKMLPVLKIGEDILVGFGRAELEQALVANGVADLADIAD